MVKPDVAERFLAAPLLGGVDPDSRRALLEVLEEDRAPEGAIVLTQGGPSDRLVFLIAGTVVIERSLPGGRIETLATLTAPAVFGTISFFLRNPPTVSVRATTEVQMLTLSHPAYERLRRQDPRAAEALALAIVRVLAERFDLLDRRVSSSIDQHAGDHPKVTEWSDFRARLFEEPNI